MRVPIIFVTVFLIVLNVEARRFKPTWDDLDTRILPEWYDRAKVGIILHWGVYSVPGYYSEWFWDDWSSNNDIKEFMKKNYRPNFTYQDFAPEFRAEFYDPEAWTKLFVNAGAKYVILTSKHHEGFALFPACRSYSWNAMDVGPKRDLVGDLAAAVRKTDIKFGLYHSLYEWFNPIYLEDQTAGFNITTSRYPKTKMLPELKQIVNDYKPAVLWSDGDQHNSDDYWNSTEILAYLYNDSPVKDEIVVNDRWGYGTAGKHGDFYNDGDESSHQTLQKHKWESIFKLDGNSWGYRRNINFDDTLSINEILKNVVTAVSCGGNALLNVGPTKEGTISPIFQERLLQLGNWLKVNGAAIYDTSPWFHQKDSHNGDVWYTCSKTPYNAEHPTAVPRKTDNVTAFYAIILQRPKVDYLMLKDAVPFLKDYLSNYFDGRQRKLEVQRHQRNGLAFIEFPFETTMNSNPQVWTLKFSRN